MRITNDECRDSSAARRVPDTARRQFKASKLSEKMKRAQIARLPTLMSENTTNTTRARHTAGIRARQTNESNTHHDARPAVWLGKHKQ